MISCRIGLLAKCKDHEFSIVLGELFDKTIKNSNDILYDLHKQLVYLCNFYGKISGKKIVPDNREDLSIYQKRYKITNSYKIIGPSVNGEWRFIRPELYDLDCMVTLFPDIISKSIYTPTSIDSTYVILLADKDPLVRGSMIDRCLDISNGKYMKFHIFDMDPLKTTCILTKRYLLAKGIKDVNITISENVLESILSVLLSSNYPRVIISVNSSKIQNLARYIRIQRKNTGLITKVIFLSDL